MQDIDLDEVKMIVGLGNPGPKFSNTRHNAGAMTVARIEAEKEIPQKVLIPSSFMNECGPEIAKAANKNGLEPNEILVIHDDIDLPPGEWKYKAGGSAGGHNGLRSLITALGSDDFHRLRIGVGRPFPHKPTTPAEEEVVSEYVLSPVSEVEREKIDQVIAKIIDQLF